MNVVLKNENGQVPLQLYEISIFSVELSSNSEFFVHNHEFRKITLYTLLGIVSIQQMQKCIPPVLIFNWKTRKYCGPAEKRDNS